MDDKLILQPNWHSEIYRTLTPKLDVTTLYNYLDFIEVSKDGHVLIGSSNLTGRTWYGSVWYYENVDLACVNLTTYVANKTISSGVVDGKFLTNDSTKVIIVDDSGCIQVLSLPENGDEPDDKLQLIKISEEHENIITDVSLFKTNDHQLITSSVDLTIKIWDLEYTRVESNEYLNSLKTYNSAHSDTITSIDTHSTNSNVFVSCALDKQLLLWDQRVDHNKHAKLLYANEFVGLTNVKWHPSNGEHLLNVTTECGDLYVIDVRECHSNQQQHLYKLNLYDDQTSVYRMKYNAASSPTLLSVCGDNNHVRVLDMSNLNHKCDQSNVIYSNNSKHTDMIRGLAWSNHTTLLTCGWDQKIYKHYINK